jgi:hypothetical protein
MTIFMAVTIIVQKIKPFANTLFLPIKKLFSPLTRLLYLDVHFFTSPGINNEPLCLAYLGMDKIRARCWGKRIGGEDVIESTGKRIWLWNLESYLTKHQPDCQLVMVEICKLSEALLFLKRGFKLPTWMHLALDSSKSLEELKKSCFRLKVEIPRLIRKNNLGYEISNNPAELDDFIEQMHKPFIVGRHGDSAFLCSNQSILDVFQKSDLLYITQEGTRIAGIMLQYENGLAALRFSGVKDNRLEYYRSGCIGALYYYGLQHVMEKGIPCFDFGGTSPFLTDNLTYFKLSFKPFVMKTTYLTDVVIKMIFRKKDSALTHFLQGHPFIAISQHNHFDRHVFANAETIESAAQFDELFKNIQCGNLATTRIHVQGDMEKIKNLASQSALSGPAFVYKKWKSI